MASKGLEMRGADLLVQTLLAAGVKKIFSLSGNQIMPIYDACIGHEIEIVHVRHEAAAVFMADAWSQLTGEIGIALVTAAPGVTNAIAPLYTARQSESAVLLLSGDSPVSQDGKGAFQELDQVSITRPLTKLSLRVASGASLAQNLVHAIQTALSGRPGPVHLALPFDILEGAVADEAPVSPDRLQAIQPPADAIDIAAVSAAIARASRPLVLCGPSLNATRFGGHLSALSEVLDAPIVPMESPRGLKDPSLGDFATAVAEADLIVSLGKPVDFSLAFGRGTSATCRWIVVDADVVELERAQTNLGGRLVSAIAADPRAMTKSLACSEPPEKHAARPAWKARVRELIAARSFKAVTRPKSDKIHAMELCDAVQQRIDRAQDAIVICDGGEFGQWAQAVISGAARIINGPSGAIGGGLCYALAAKKARPDATVFALMGDGTIGFHLAEFETAVRDNAPFVAIIGNDQRWNAEYLIQLREYGPQRLIGCGLSSARYDLAVAGLGGHGEFVTNVADLGPAIDRSVNAGKVACINVMIDGQPAPTMASH